MYTLTQEIDKSINKKTWSIVNSITKANGEVYLIGGAIRDIALGFSISDFDFEVYNIKLYPLILAVNKDSYINFKFQTLKYLNLEFSLPRIETKIEKGYSDYKINVDINLSRELAIQRRDFTINALMYDLKAKKIYDYCNGLSDLNNKILKAVNYQKYTEDSIRTLRFLKYKFKYDFTVDDKTYNLSKKMANQLLFQPSNIINKYLRTIIISDFFNLSIFLDILQSFFKIKNNAIYIKRYQNIKTHNITSNDYYIVFFLIILNNSEHSSNELEQLINKLFLKKREVELVQTLLIILNDKNNINDYSINAKNNYRKYIELVEYLKTKDGDKNVK
ncbi:hypothetical protein [Mycoplasma sp. P36-A1]|uniref:hypothetical protein n=1 Tax=Mycoplasma sp. P36-A1 TaxID=3252900 RepID=UPI003C2FC4C2